jgi:hypothetical protein
MATVPSLNCGVASEGPIVDGRNGPTSLSDNVCGEGPFANRLLGDQKSIWLGNLDSNQDKQSQSLLCYRYTIPQ